VIYDYRCESCSAKFQFDTPMASPITKGRHKGAKCPHCSSTKVKKIIHRAEIIFKGGGFYKTDSKK
jgi:putative FmdB family regulatory protein